MSSWSCHSWLNKKKRIKIWNLIFSGAWWMTDRSDANWSPKLIGDQQRAEDVNVICVCTGEALVEHGAGTGRALQLLDGWAQSEHWTCTATSLCEHRSSMTRELDVHWSEYVVVEPSKMKSSDLIWWCWSDLTWRWTKKQTDSAECWENCHRFQIAIDFDGVAGWWCWIRLIRWTEELLDSVAEIEIRRAKNLWISQWSMTKLLQSRRWIWSDQIMYELKCKQELDLHWAFLSD